jgi:phosphatidate cytidylyltransferase
MHLKRWITGLAALPVLVFFIWQGGWVLGVFVAAAALVALWEYYRIVFALSGPRLSSPIPLVGFLVSPLMIAAACAGFPAALVALLVLDLLLVTLCGLRRYGSDPAVVDTVTRQLAGMIYIPLLLAHVILLRAQAYGIEWIFFLLVLVFANDIGALYAGLAFGRHKLCPAVSPGKTVEGSVGGMAACIGLGALYKHVFFSELPWLESLGFFLCVGAAGPLGDLFESMLKRKAKIKDSGVLFPGHGGILDRIDALLFAAPVAYYYKMYIF